LFPSINLSAAMHLPVRFLETAHMSQCNSYNNINTKIHIMTCLLKARIV
jgi:hypothetical protein